MSTNSAEPERILTDKLSQRKLWAKLFNFRAAQTQAAMGLEYSSAMPYWLTIDPTSVCQLQCPFCPTGQRRGVRPSVMMDIALFRAVMKQLGPYLLHADLMNWGEPLLHPDIFEMIALTKSHRVETLISSNMNNLPDDGAEKLVLSGLDLLTVSIDGAAQESYSKYRVGGNFAAAVENTARIARAKLKLGRCNPKISWQFLVFRHNEHEIEAARALAMEAGANEIGFTAPNLPFKPGIKDDWMSTLPQYALYDPENFPERPPWEWEQVTDQTGKPADVSVDVYAGSKLRHPCKWPWTAIAINPDGSVSPCCSVEERIHDFGSLTEHSFQEIWNNGHYRAARRHIAAFARGEKNSLPASQHACERCFSIGRSDFRMPHWWETDRLDSYPDPLAPHKDCK